MAAEQAQLSKREVLERESRWARPTLLSAIAIALLFILAAIIGSGDLSNADDSAQFLEDFEQVTGSQLVVSLLQAAGLALLAVPLFYLFQAAAARSGRMRTAFVGLTVAGPLFLAGAFAARWIAFDGASADFVMGVGDQAADPDTRADDLIEDQTAFGVTQGLQFAGGIGVAFGVGYTTLYAMRVGLLTRVWGAIGIALGISVLLLGTAIGVLAFIVAIGFMIGGYWPGGRPPAWEAGEAIPWPKGGPPDRDPPPEQEPGLPDGFGDRAEDTDPPAETYDPVGSPRKRKRRR